VAYATIGAGLAREDARLMVTVPTSAGEVGVADLGVVLMHEHVFVRSEVLAAGWPGFGGWDRDTQVSAARERLARLKRSGVDTIVDMTIPGLGRDVAAVAAAAAGTGLNVLFATGFFTLDCLPFPFQYRGPDKFLDHDDRLLESLFERDITEGIAGTGIRAAVLKHVADARGMTEDVTRLATAVARVAVRTGVPVITHAHAPTRRGLDQLRLFTSHGLDPARVLIGHSSESTDLDYLEGLIRAGCYLGWDRHAQSLEVAPEAQLDTLAELCWRGHASRIMLSRHKPSFIDWWTEAELDKLMSRWRGTSLDAGVLPGLRDRGVPETDIDQMLVGNPRDFFGQGGGAG
jgi:phosphotriesterase-related protein